MMNILDKNGTVATGDGSRSLSPQLWVPYVLIGVSCVTFLGVHFWCYHKRNRERYLRKREEKRVKCGLLERRRITTLMVAKYQSELSIAESSCHDLEGEALYYYENMSQVVVDDVDDPSHSRHCQARTDDSPLNSTPAPRNPASVPDTATSIVSDRPGDTSVTVKVARKAPLTIPEDDTSLSLCEEADDPKNATESIINVPAVKKSDATKIKEVPLSSQSWYNQDLSDAVPALGYKHRKQGLTRRASLGDDQIESSVNNPSRPFLICGSNRTKTFPNVCYSTLDAPPSFESLVPALRMSRRKKRRVDGSPVDGVTENPSHHQVASDGRYSPGTDSRSSSEPRRHDAASARSDTAGRLTSGGEDRGQSCSARGEPSRSDETGQSRNRKVQEQVPVFVEINSAFPDSFQNDSDCGTDSKDQEEPMPLLSVVRQNSVGTYSFLVDGNSLQTESNTDANGSAEIDEVGTTKAGAPSPSEGGAMKRIEDGNVDKDSNGLPKDTAEHKHDRPQCVNRSDNKDVEHPDCIQVEFVDSELSPNGNTEKAHDTGNSFHGGLLSNAPLDNCGNEERDAAISPWEDTLDAPAQKSECVPQLRTPALRSLDPKLVFQKSNRNQK